MIDSFYNDLADKATKIAIIRNEINLYEIDIDKIRYKN